MTRLWNEPDHFVDDMTAGFVRAHADLVAQAPGGVVRATRGIEPEVALVVGGGSGHYPAFAGLVGPGLAHGAVMGNLFASPSARQVESIARACDQGRGVLLSYGNYAGDVLHFTAAQDALRASGIDCRTVVVTDDIFSAPPEQADKRRGIAGDLVVFKIAGAAAGEGADLDRVAALAEHANERTRSMGVAFTGCSLPGAEEPLFSVPEGKMAIGLGIHGEPGIDLVDIPSARDLADLFVDRLLADVDGLDWATGRVIPVLNGLGSVKYEELYVVYGRIDERLRAAGLEPVYPAVGEFCTSFDMAGASLTLLWADDELERLWTRPAVTAAYRTTAADTGDLVANDLAAAEVVKGALAPGSAASQAVAHCVRRALAATAQVIDENVDLLGRMDSIAGDGDHGIGMQRGSAAAHDAAQAADATLGAGTVLALAAEAWADRAGGTSGMLWGVILEAVGAELGDERGDDPTALAAGVARARDEVHRRGGARPGDKTLVDALVPFADTLVAAVAEGNALSAAWSRAARAAQEGADATGPMLPGLGRARTHGERALGHPDPGAVSLAMIANEIGRVIAHDQNDSTEE